MARKRTKKTTGQKAIKYQQGRPTPNPRGFIGGNSSSPTFDIAEALVNPFSQRARGAKIPDDDSSRSIATTCISRHTLSMSSGATVISVQPILDNLVTPSSTLDGNGGVTAWGTGQSMTDYSSYASSFSTYRIVSWGVRVIPLAAPTDQSGSITIMTLSESPTGGTFNPNVSFFEEIEAFPVVGSDIHWVSKPQGVTWKEYVALNTPQNWTNCVIQVVGYPTTASIMVEVFLNLEAQFNIGSITGAIATPAADHNPHALQLADHTRNRMKQTHPSHPTFLDRLKGAMYSGLTTMADMALPAAGRALMRVFAPAKSMPRIVDVD